MAKDACCRIPRYEAEQFAGMLVFRVVKGLKKYRCRCASCGTTKDVGAIEAQRITRRATLAACRGIS